MSSILFLKYEKKSTNSNHTSNMYNIMYYFLDLDLLFNILKCIPKKNIGETD